MSEVTVKKAHKLLVKKFDEDQIENFNVIFELLKALQQKDKYDKNSYRIISTLVSMFSSLLNKNIIKKQFQEDKSSLPALEKFYLVAQKTYNDFWDILVTGLTSKDQKTSEIIFQNSLRLLKAEGQSNIEGTDFSKKNVTSSNVTKCTFPYSNWKRIISAVFSVNEVDCFLLSQLKQFMPYKDLIFFTIKALKEMYEPLKKSDSEIFLNNIFLLHESINFPDANSIEEYDSQNWVDYGKNPQYQFDYSEFKYEISGFWALLLQCNFSRHLYAKSFILLSDKVMLHLEDPLMLTDFYMDAFNIGGAVSLLSLHGVFILITNYNLDYPDFYKKLYSLFESSILKAKYKARFFMLCDKFLTSTHLPEYYAAAFAKRLSRLMLESPAPSLVMMIQFVMNIIIRYPTLHRMIHAPNAEHLEDDPYIHSEPDPALCRAGESSLWEITTLLKHPSPAVSRAASRIFKRLPVIEYKIAMHVEDTYEEMYEEARKIKREKMEVEYRNAENFFKENDDIMTASWTTTL